MNDKIYFQLKGKFKSKDEIINGTIDITKHNLDCASGYSRGMHMIECPICGKIVNIITSVHLAKHNLTLTEFIALDESFIGLTEVQDTKESTVVNKRRNNRLRHARNYYNKNKEAIALKVKEKRANNRDKTLGIRKNRIGGRSNA